MGNQNGCGGSFMQMAYPESACDAGCEAVCAICGQEADYPTCEPDCGCAACTGRSKRGKKHAETRCACESAQADETHVFFDPCDGFKEICITSRCEEDEAPGRTLDVTATLTNVCPGRRSALGITLAEIDEDGTEYARGFRAVTVPAHNGRCNQDVQLDSVRFILPEDLKLQNRRHFVIRTQHHYLDASSIWNNGWGCKN